MKEKTHGTRTTYNAGCRCEKCRQANTTYMSKYLRERSTATAPAHRNKCPWQPWEDNQARDYTKSARQIAQILERTPTAVENRRRILLARKNNQ